MSAYFGGAPNAFAGGEMFAGAQIEQLAQENALKAMIARFGPEAANPQALQMLQQTQQQAEIHPLTMSGLQREDAAMGAAVGQHGPIAGSPAAVNIHSTLTNQGRATQEHDRETYTRAGRMAATYLQQVRDRGGDLGQAFGMIRNTLPNLGVPEDRLDALQQHIMSNPDSLDELMAMFNAGDGGGSAVRAVGQPNPVYHGGQLRMVQSMSDGSQRIVEVDGQPVVPAMAQHSAGRLDQGQQRIEQNDRRLSLDEQRTMRDDPPPGMQYIWTGEPGNSAVEAVPIRGSMQELEQDTLLAGRVQEATNNIGTLRVTVLEPARTVERDFGTALGIMENSRFFQGEGGFFQGLGRHIASKAYDADVAQIVKEMESAKANIGFAQLSNMPRGLGHVTERQLEVLQSVLGNFKIGMQPHILKRNMSEAIELYQQIQENARLEIERQQAELESARIMRELRRRNMDNTAPSQMQYAPPGGVSGVNYQPPPGVADLMNQFAPPP